MSTTTALPHLNGNGVVPVETLCEADFLEKLLQIRDEVLASKHPRIHLPPKVLEQVAPRLSQHTPPSRPTTNGTPNGTQTLQPFPLRPDSAARQHPKNELVSPVPQAQRPFSAKSTSGIDPVLLTKSAHLIRAELQLKRQQIERALKDQLDKKGRANDTLVDDREARFDVEDILAKAQELVKPLSGLQITVTNSDGAESFDENSYYSSKWSSEEVDSNQNASADAADPLTSQAKRFVTEAQLTPAKPASRPEPQADATVIDLDDEPYEPADDIEIYEPEPAKGREEADESDYSPPPADVGPSEPNRGRPRDRGHQNHGGVNGSSRRQSPTGQPPPLQNSRKRRREEKREEKRRQQANKRVARSPEPYIKEEPQSPPPFASYPEAQPSKRRALQPLPSDVEVVSTREGSRMQPVYYREQEPASRSYRHYEEPLSPTVVRVPQRRGERDDQDLRRVASLQYARRPFSPAGDLYAPEPRQIRAASHAFTERPIEHHIFRESSARPSAAPRYVRERSRSPVYEYLHRAQSPAIMAPPPRIVTDQYGNKFYAAPVDARESMVPPGRRIDVDPYYERAGTREPTRAPVRTELYDEDEGQMMPPPPRRFIEATDAEIVETRPYRQREPSHRPTDIEYRPQEAVERRPIMQYEEMGPPRPQLRSYSVRPEIVRQELPEGYVRHESVQPGFARMAAPRYRELSMIRQDPYDDRRYTLAPPQARRYVEDGAADRPIELAQEPYGESRRVSYRY